MKVALASICSVLCLCFTAFWIALILYANGMGSVSGNYPWGLFSKFWVVAPFVLALIGAVAVWLPLSTVTKTTLLGSLIVFCFASLLIENVTPFGKSTVQTKLPQVLLGSIPILFPLATWIAGFLLDTKNAWKRNRRSDNP